LKKYICEKHQSTLFSIPDTVEECISFNSFEEIKSLELHLQNSPECKMIECEVPN
jgi:hypothetical protein